MKAQRFFLFLLLGALLFPALSSLPAQEKVHQIIDHVALPASLMPPGGSDCYMEFAETWTFFQKGALLKEVKSQNVSCSEEGKELSLSENPGRIKNINYEFMLLDPHVLESGDTGFPEADSMDAPTRQLQADLIQLIQRLDPMSKRYDPASQMLSLYFHEEWEWDPESQLIRKSVKAITPVIWQRRQSEEGRPINDADSGLPVYYKNELQRINLRQP